MEIYVDPITILVWWLGPAQHNVAWCQQHYCNLWLLMYVITLDGTDQLNPSGTTIIQENINNKLTFSIFSQYWDGAKSRKSSWQKTKILLSYIINDVVLTKYDQNILSSVPEWWTGDRFTNDFLPAIQIRWKLRLAVIPLLAVRSQQIFAHATTAQLSYPVQNYRNWPRYGLRWSGLCCHSRHSTSGPAVARPCRPAHECCAGSGSTNHDSADRMSGQFLFYHENEAKHDKSHDGHDDERHAESPWLTAPLWWWKRP